VDSEVKQKPKRQAQVRLENLDANTVRKIARSSGVEIPYLLREAVQLLQAKYSVKS
jgi:hypothetical protein